MSTRSVPAASVDRRPSARSQRGSATRLTAAGQSSGGLGDLVDLGDRGHLGDRSDLVDRDDLGPVPDTIPDLSAIEDVFGSGLDSDELGDDHVADDLADWRFGAACGSAEAEIFFPPESVDPQEQCRREAVAKEICAGCPVRVQCLLSAVVAGERYGVWGGTTAAERLKGSLLWRGAA